MAYPNQMIEAMVMLADSLQFCVFDFSWRTPKNFYPTLDVCQNLIFFAAFLMRLLRNRERCRDHTAVFFRVKNDPTDQVQTRARCSFQKKGRNSFQSDIRDCGKRGVF